MDFIVLRRRAADFMRARLTLATISLACASSVACDGNRTVDPVEPSLMPRFNEMYAYNGLSGLTAPESDSLNLGWSPSVSAVNPTSLAAVLPAGSVAVEPQSATLVNNCIPFGSNIVLGFTGFIYRNVPAFTLSPGDKIAFDLGRLNGQDTRRDIYFSAASTNPARAVVSGSNLVSQNVRALQWVKVASETEIPLNPRGNTIVGDYELEYTAITSFSFGGGGFMIGFAAAPPATIVDGGCEQVLVHTTGFDVSNKFYTRFLGKSHLDGGTLDSGSGSDLTQFIGGFRMIKVNQPPSVEFADPAASSVNEGAPLSVVLNVTDPNDDPLSYDASFGDGVSVTAVPITGSPFAVEHTYVDDAQALTLSVTVNDGVETATAVKNVTVVNVAPSVGVPAVPADPAPAGSEVTVSAAFTDPGKADTHVGAAQWDAGGGFETAGVTVADGVVTARKMLAPGVYSVTLMVTDDDGGEGRSSATAYVVVYDPNGGFITGGGWIVSPEGACAPSACVYTGEDKATFGFSAKYKPGASASTSGNTEFEFKAGGFKFTSTVYQWVVVAGGKAQFKGEGVVNGEGDFGFLLTAIDGALRGAGSADALRIKVWNKATGETVYDNRRGAGEDSDDATALGAGSIVIHK